MPSKCTRAAEWRRENSSPLLFSRVSAGLPISKVKLPAFFKEYQELVNFVTGQQNAGEAIGIIREKVLRLQAEAAEIKRLNQLLMPETFRQRKLNRHLLHYSQNRGTLPEEDWDEV